MKRDRAALLDVIESVADGAALDWAALEAGLEDDHDRRLFAQLKVLARIAEVHRSQPDDPADHVVPGRSLGGKVIGEIRPQRPVDTLNVEDGLPAMADALLAGGAGRIGRDAFLPPASAHAVEPGDRPLVPEALAGGAAAGLAPDARPSRIWGHLELLERIGEGTFGEVYRARDTKLHREVAVKLLRVGGGQEDRLTETVLREARILARVRHPNVVLVHGAETRDGRVGLWMELIRGATLEHMLQTHGPFSAREAAVIGQDLCRALAAVHGAGLVHRDVKAQNVMREEGGRLVLMDFGAGQWLGGGQTAASGRITGTPLYLAPEVLAGGEATVPSDIYSLGVLLYHLVTGNYPLRARSVEDLREAHRSGIRTRLQDARPDLQDNLVEVIERALDPAPNRRFSSAGEMQAALSHALGVGVAGGTPPVRETIQPLLGPSSEPARDAAAGVVPGWSLIAAACGVALVGGALATGLFSAGSWNPFTPATPVAALQTIAVLPIQNLNGGSDPVLIEMQDALISSLGRISSVRTISRTSTAAYATTSKLMPEIGKDLKADYIVESMATREGDRVKLMPRLVRAGDDTQVWAGTIERPLTQVLQMGGVALEMASALGARVSTDERHGLVAEQTPRPEAQTAYLDGRYQMSRGTSESYRLARAQFERAIAVDPGYARAFASLAQAEMWLYLDGGERLEQASRVTLTAAERAVAIDPGSSVAHTRLAIAKIFFNRDWKGAEEGYRRALELNPSDTEARSEYARLLAAKGDMPAALQMAEIGREADPLSADATGTVAVMHYYARDFDKAEAETRRALEFGSTNPRRYLTLGRVLSAKRDCAGAIDALRRAGQMSNHAPIIDGELARVYAVCGQVDEARRMLAVLEQPGRSASGEVAPQILAYVYAALGDRDRAFTALRAAVARRESPVVWAKVDPRLDPLRSDSRFGAILQELGLSN